MLAFWQKNDIFNKSVTRDAPKGDYVFHDGPPFATGTPHYGHLVGSAMKDAVPRYWTMKGYRVERQWGWDCHGLPIENIVEKELGTKSKKDVEHLGVKNFNDLCRKQIFTYVDIWNQFIPRFGRWADMENPYRTMDKDYMESEWWAFKTLYEKGLIYEDYRSMHICPRCETTLSQSEVSEGYKDVKDLSVTAKFKVKPGQKIGDFVTDDNTYILAWTTTPWTLPGNVALAVGKDVEYSLISTTEKGSGNALQPDGSYQIEDLSEATFILLKGKEDLIRADYFFEDEDVSVRKGSDLVGLEYEPLFDYYAKDSNLKNRENGWKVYAADFVTTDTGTGIVHIAPAFGEDDMQLGKRENLPFVQHVSMDGRFKPDVTDFAGHHVKPKDDVQATDVAIIKYLAGKGLLFAKEKYEHSYPHCWRCETPLLNYATSSWFVAVEKLKPDLLEYATAINWSPAHLKAGRFGKWLEGARDWSISRQRFWANTIPVWRCPACTGERVFGSAAELEEASGVKVDDLHKDVVDDITVKCTCGAHMKRVPDVLDTWFNSGSVPFASLHYPMEHEQEFKKRVPADFIAEGIDQCRTWFYYQHVLAGALFKTHAFKNVIANGIALAEDGKKMSKRLKNYPDPVDIINTYGADATRLYMLSSPIVAAENLNFAESGVADISRKIFGRLVNVYEFYALYADGVTHTAHDTSTHVLDRWIIARLNEVIRETTQQMDAYSLNGATRPFGDFVDDLSTWYLRRSRERFKGDDEADKKAALETLRFVLREFAKVIAPFTPFHADWLWLKLKEKGDAESVHLAQWPQGGGVDTDILAAMLYARSFVTIALMQRSENGVKVRQPLSRLTIKHTAPPPPYWEEVVPLIKDEVNVKEVILDGTKGADGPGIVLDTELTPELIREGHVRDIIRAVQDLRKKKGLNPGDKAVLVAAPSSNQLKELLEYARPELTKVAALSDIEYAEGMESAETLTLSDGTIQLLLK